MLNEILIPHIEVKQNELNLQSNPWVLICEFIKGKWTDAVKDIVQKSNGKMVPVPNNCKNYFQQVYLTVNKNSKDFLHQLAQIWYPQKIVKQMEAIKRSQEI